MAFPQKSTVLRGCNEQGRIFKNDTQGAKRAGAIFFCFCNALVEKFKRKYGDVDYHEAFRMPVRKFS